MSYVNRVIIHGVMIWLNAETTHTAKWRENQRSHYLARADAVWSTSSGPTETEPWRLVQCTSRVTEYVENTHTHSQPLTDNFFSRSVWVPQYPFSAFTLLVGQQQGHPACKKNWFGLLVVTRTFRPPPSPAATIQSRTETLWYHLTQVHLENGR